MTESGHYNRSYSLQSFYHAAMSISTETIKQDLDQLTDDQLRQVVNFIAFLKFQDKRRRVVLDPDQLASLSTEFAEEDRALSEEGMNDYAAMLHHEDRL